MDDIRKMDIKDLEPQVVELKVPYNVSVRKNGEEVVLSIGEYVTSENLNIIRIFKQSKDSVIMTRNLKNFSMIMSQQYFDYYAHKNNLKSMPGGEMILKLAPVEPLASKIYSAMFKFMENFDEPTLV